ncbi:hypothetical protein MMC11_003025 [Xylographa trunciseda]|nr:hypothetical protein [Xylographa trunciseda]
MPARKEHPAGVYFQKTIEQNEKRRRERRKAEQERMISDEVGTLSWTSGFMEDITREPAEQLHQSLHNIHELGTCESTIQALPSQSAPSQPWFLPGPQPPPSPQSSEAESSYTCNLGDVEKQEIGGHERVQKLEADLRSARTDIRTLQQAVERAELDIKRLRVQRNETIREIAQAHSNRNSQDSDTAKLEERMRRLMGQIERLIVDQNHAEDQITEGRARELQLVRELEAARQESKQLINVANERERAWKHNEHRPRSKTTDVKTLRKVSSRQTGPRTIEKTTVEFTFEKDEARETGCGCLIM